MRSTATVRMIPVVIERLLKRALIFAHRWLGVALSAILMLWFASGIVMLYRSYPSVTVRDRLEHLPVLDPSQIKLSAEEAFAALGPDGQPAHVLLTSFDGRPVYFGGGALIYADDGSQPRDVDSAMIDRAAAAWSGRPIDQAEKTSVDEPDQWTLSSDLRGLRPLFKYSWPDGQQVYVDGNTGDVVQYTTTSSRLWAYLGAIPHWLYFTPLRVQQGPWFSIIVWSSVIGSVAALIGFVIAAWMYSPRRRYRHEGRPTSIPYRGWKRWHTVAGLCFGVIATTWTFSGLLTMGPFPLVDKVSSFIRPEVQPSGHHHEVDLFRVFRAGRLDFSHYADRHPSAAIAALRGFDVKEIEYSSFGGKALYVASDGNGDTRIVPVHGAPFKNFDTDDLMRRVRNALDEHLVELRLMDKYDAYYVDRRGLRPLPVIFARFDDAVGSRYYIDPRTATLAGSYTANQWVERWLTRGLHSLDFPWLYNNRPLWDIVVVSLLLGGAGLCFTSLVLTWRVVSRTLASLLRARVVSPVEDLLSPEFVKKV